MSGRCRSCGRGGSRRRPVRRRRHRTVFSQVRFWGLVLVVSCGYMIWLKATGRA